MSHRLDPLFLPYTDADLLEHFISTPLDAEEPARHLKRWRTRIADAPSKDPAFLHRDETLWTAGGLLAVHRHADAAERWCSLLSLLFGPHPPMQQLHSWRDLLEGELELFFEVGLSSPARYRAWLSERLGERHPLRPQVALGETRGLALEGRTQLDALLLNTTTGFALHIEAKVLSDVDTKTTFDSLRNQLARNLDCMTAPAPSEGLLAQRRPDRSFFALLTPELFRRHWRSRLYGHLIREYQLDPAALQRDLPHLDGATCTALARRIGWLTFEDLRTVAPEACPWLDEPAAVAPATRPPHHLPQAQPQSSSWPSRFTAGWLRRQVPTLSDDDYRALLAELSRRNWTKKDLRERDFSFRDIAPSVAPRPPVLDQSDPVGRATARAAEQLEVLSQARGGVRERDLQEALGRELRGGDLERKVVVPGWDPQPGNLDVLVRADDGALTHVIETKLKADDRIFECLWDFAKVLSLTRGEANPVAYLVVGTTHAGWSVYAGTELFTDGTHGLVEAIERNLEWWIKYVLGDSSGRPLEVAGCMDVSVVAAVPMTLNDELWELRAVRVSASDVWVPFVDGLPSTEGVA